MIHVGVWRCDGIPNVATLSPIPWEERKFDGDKQRCEACGEWSAPNDIIDQVRPVGYLTNDELEALTSTLAKTMTALETTVHIRRFVDYIGKCKHALSSIVHFDVTSFTEVSK